jgi:hypothetical protein
VNTTDIRLSSVTGDGIDEFVQLVATTAMALPHVNQSVPMAYVDLGSHLEAWSRELIAEHEPPVRTRDEVLARVAATPLLASQFSDPSAIARALAFLTSGGVVVVAHDAVEQVLILDPGWLADTLACVVTLDPEHLLELPPALQQRGLLRHTQDALGGVWPTTRGFTSRLHQTLLPLLHRFSLAYELRDSSDDTIGYSLVPCMLPAGPGGEICLDGAIGRVAQGQREVGVEYQLGYLPPDLWPHLILRCSAMVIPEACTRSTAVLQHGGQRALVAVQPNGNSLRLIARGSDPEELRVRVHWTLLGLCADKFPFLRTDGSVHAVCHVCHRTSRAVVGRSSDTSFHCEHILPVSELVRTPSAALDAALVTPVSNMADVAALCRAAARMVDTCSVLLDSQGR